ncbi:SEC63 [Symbiodinium sp. CCMP2456]|nr:SEC63 [Symbiodinium sp. CCMP2456]
MLCRVVLGRILELPRKDPKAHERVIGTDFTSVMGCADGANREFIVFDVSQVYPEYVMFYCAEGGEMEELATEPSGTVCGADVDTRRARQLSCFYVEYVAVCMSFDKWQVLGVDADSSAAKSEDEVRRISSQKILAALGKPYTVLGLQPGASSAAIRRAYHVLALLHHPDKGGDDAVFKAIATAYKALTEAKTEEGGWRDLEGQAVGPWQGHAPTATKGITCMLFDTFGTPPWESRRLYTGSWQEGVVRCWELSKGEPGKTKPPPRLVGEIAVGGFINDVAAISPFGLLTAQSAGMKPLPGESLRTWNLKTTPFRPVARAKTNAIADDPDAKSKAIMSSDAGRDGNGSTAIVAKKDDEELDFVKDEDGGYLEKSTMVYLHYRGVRCISLWPKPENREATPHVAATVSKDVLAVSKIGMDGVSLQVPAVWQQPDPHQGVGDVNAMQHETVNKIWTGDNGGNLRCWDVNASGKGVVSDFNSQAAGWLSGLAMWPESGVMVCSHSSGIGYIDIRAGKVIRQQYTKESVGKVTVLNWTSPMLFAGIGGELMQYDTRCFADGQDYKPKAVASWTLGSPITSLHCTETGKGHLLVAAGCMNGKVAAFDSS